MYVIKIFINKTARKIQKDVIQYIIYQTKPKTITPETFKNIDTVEITSNLSLNLSGELF